MSQLISISFIVPMYKVEEYLSECIETILNQDISKEIILINDGSPDNTLNIALDYANKYDFITLIHTRNKGQSAARNKGIQIAQGEYIYFVDSDDYLSNNIFSEIMSEAKNHQVDLIRVQSERIYPNGVSHSIPSIVDSLNNRFHLMTAGEALKLIIQKAWTPAICWTLFKREFLLKNRLTFVEGVRAEDQLFYLQSLTVDLNAKLLEVPHLVYHYRIRAGSTCTTPTVSYFIDHFKIIEMIKQWIIEKNINEDIDTFKDIIISIIIPLYKTAYGIYLKYPEDIREHMYPYFNSEAKYLLSLVNIELE